MYLDGSNTRPRIICQSSTTTHYRTSLHRLNAPKHFWEAAPRSFYLASIILSSLLSLKEGLWVLLNGKVSSLIVSFRKLTFSDAHTILRNGCYGCLFWRGSSRCDGAECDPNLRPRRLMYIALYILVIPTSLLQDPNLKSTRHLPEVRCPSNQQCVCLFVWRRQNLQLPTR